MKFIRPVILFLGLVLSWQFLVLITQVPHYILPGPGPVVKAIYANWPTLIFHLKTTLTSLN